MPAKDDLSLAPAKVDGYDDKINEAQEIALQVAEIPDPPVHERLPAMAPSEELEVVSTKAEGGLQSEAEVLDEQARQAQPLREGENLLPKATPVSTRTSP